MADTSWRINYDNETGPQDDSFCEWWTVSDGTRSFQCPLEEDAEWLLKLLLKGSKDD